MIPSCAGNNSQSSPLMYLWIGIAVVIFTVVLFVLVVLLFIWAVCCHSRHQQARDRVSEHNIRDTIENIAFYFTSFLLSQEKLHYLARIVEQQIDNNEVLIIFHRNDTPAL